MSVLLHIYNSLGYGVMVTQQILVLLFLVRVRVSQLQRDCKMQSLFCFIHLAKGSWILLTTQYYCKCQRKALQMPTQSFACAIAKLCMCHRNTIAWISAPCWPRLLTLLTCRIHRSYSICPCRQITNSMLVGALRSNGGSWSKNAAQNHCYVHWLRLSVLTVIKYMVYFDGRIGQLY